MTKVVRVGNVLIGGSNPISIQSMYDVPLEKLESNFKQRMENLKAMGCDIMRFSYPDIKDHDALKEAVRLCPMPSVADIHFDYKNALDSMDCNVSAIRINPGNIGARWKTEEIVRKALDRNIAIRIGLNSGSLPENTKKQDTSSLMVDTALEYISWFENLGFYNTVVSLKASDIDTTTKSYKLFSEKSDYPLHLGITEAGGVVTSCVRTTWALGSLLKENIGSTLRYSITGSIEDEVIAAFELLRTLGLRKDKIRIVSCPMCGRKTFNTQAFLAKIQNELLAVDKNLTVAIMGCQVNGPGEAQNADVAITGIGNKVFLYKNGQIFKETTDDKAQEDLLKLVSDY